MAETIEELVAQIREAVEPGYRGRLVARGLARGLIWEDGVTPDGAPAFADTLSVDLRGYGYSLAHLALRLKEMEGPNDVVELGLERAAEALEALVRKGDPTDPFRGLDTTVAAASYHLSHFGARAYSLIGGNFDRLNLAPFERLLCRLLRSDLAGLRGEAASIIFGKSYQDAHVASMIEAGASADDYIDANVLMLTAHLARALLAFELALRRGSKPLAEQAVDMVALGEDIGKELHHPTVWWVFLLARHVLGDLWKNSGHELLPNPDGGDWPSLRRTYLALLANSDPTEVLFWPSQVEAAARATSDDDDLVVSLPTSAGKTRIAELCILRALSHGKRVVYVTPLRALSAQVERALARAFRPIGFSVSSLYGAAGASPLDRDSLSNRHIVVATPEKLDFAIRSQPELLDDVGLVVLDEGHMIGFGEREIRYEVLLQRLLRRPDSAERRLVCLSAVLPDGDSLDHFVGWIRQDEPGTPIRSQWRPTRQRFGTIKWTGNRARLDLQVGEETPYLQSFLEPIQPTGRRRKLFPSEQAELVLATAWKLASDGHQVLVFAPQKSFVNSLAKKVLKLNQQGLLSPLGDGDTTLANAAGAEWLGEEHDAVGCLGLSVGVHHGSLPHAFRRQVEKLIQARALPVVLASPTLAQGMNLGASAIVIHSLHRAGQLIKHEEFENVVGRAGRAFVDINGLILFPMYEPSWSRARQWSSLVDGVGRRSLRSGLLTLVETLLKLLHNRVGGEFESLVDYVMGQTTPLSIHPEEDNEGLLSFWPAALGLLDEAILATIDPLDCDEDQVATTLDEVLRGSLWSRWLASETDARQALFNSALQARATWIWQNSSAVDRRGYYAAGLGVASGQYLRDHLDDLCTLILASEAALASRDETTAVQGLTELHRILAQVQTFAPADPREDSDELLADWLGGTSASKISQKYGKDALDFVEDAFVYKLTWALEAVRTTAIARTHSMGEDIAGTGSAAVACGLLDPRCALMVQAGLQSRQCAQEAIAENPADFTDRRGLQEWVASCPSGPGWPSEDSGWAWAEFVSDIDAGPGAGLQKQSLELASTWAEPPPPAGLQVRLAAGKTVVMGPAFESLGTLDEPLSEDVRTIVSATVDREGATVRVEALMQGTPT